MGRSWIELRTGRDHSALCLLQAVPIPGGPVLVEQIEPLWNRLIHCGTD